MGKSINDDAKLSMLKEAWQRVEEEQMAGTEDKHGHANVSDQGKEVTDTGGETNSEVNPGGEQHNTNSEPVRNGPNFAVKEDDLDAELGGDEMGGDEMGADPMAADPMAGDELAGGDPIADAVNGLVDALRAEFGAGDDLGTGDELDDLGGDEMSDDLGGDVEEESIENIVSEYSMTESQQRMDAIRAARAARRNS